MNQEQSSWNKKKTTDTKNAYPPCEQIGYNQCLTNYNNNYNPEKDELLADLRRDNGLVKFTIHFALVKVLHKKCHEWGNLIEE